MITEQTYKEYVEFLLKGDRAHCVGIVQKLIDDKIDLEELYLQVFKRSLYETGDLWAQNKISVAVEHLATAITEYLMTLAYPLIFCGERTGKKAVLACVANEYHQVGGKMVADILELNGWATYFLGANMPIKDLIQMIEAKNPHLLCLSLSVYFNIKNLFEAITQVRMIRPALPIFVGGRAFEFCSKEIFSSYEHVVYLESLPELIKQARLLEERDAR